jgi:hypothetical protein
MADTPTPASASEHEARALQMMVDIRQLTRTIDGFMFAGKGRRVKIANFATLPDEFFELMALACDSNPDVAAAGMITSAELRSMLTSHRAYGSVAVEMRTQAKGVEDTLAEHRADVGRRALNAYEIAKRLNKQEQRQTLVPHLRAIKLALNRGGRRNAEKPGEEEVATAAPKSKEEPK